MSYLYPPAPATLTGDVTTINRFLQSPTQVTRRLRTLVDQRYISDALLTRRLQVAGGAVMYETGEVIFSTDNPRAVSPGGEYPLTGLPTGVASLAQTVKWGQDTEITDESIKRQLMDPVNRGFDKMANQNVKWIDSIALSAVASSVTATAPAAASWATATPTQIMRDVALAKANILALNQGYDPDTVVVDDINWAYAMTVFATSGLTPRESNQDNILVTGNFPVIMGMRWLATPNIPTAGTALVLDSKVLGGMADEDLGGPGYVSGPKGIEVKASRSVGREDRDAWSLRCRRVTVPVVIEPAAARKITGL